MVRQKGKSTTTTKDSGNLASVPTTMFRPPIVTVMGHVDHGKTTLLDVIRKTQVAKQETGGITQGIGAYQVEHKGKKITFIDTPGHAAFAKMRSRGAQVTDIVVLVVAATEGVKPQTVESINHIRAADVPIIVAINKMDLPEADPVRVKSELVKYEVMVEEFGGKVPVVEVSAKTGKNIEQLLDMIQLVAELTGVSGEASGELEAVVIESQLDSKRGPTATVIVRQGTLRLGETIYVDETPARVRLMVTDRGEGVREALPSMPVLVLGFGTVPSVGGVIGSKSQPARSYQPKKQLPELKMEGEVDIEAMLAGEEPAKRPSIEVILKADVEGMLEAIRSNLSDEVIIVQAGVGPVTESDVMLAADAGARIIAFNVPIPAAIEKLANNEKVAIFRYQLIYELLEDVEKQILKLLEPTIDEEELGRAEIVAEFTIKNERVAGCKVLNGELGKTDLIHWQRGDKILGEVKIRSMKRGREEIIRAKSGTECGVVLSPRVDFKVGDRLVAYKKISV
ncbi:translation initiation factor IF-2 [Microgenomates group bacterium RIFCSPHIGHO2_01_FULL_45_11]|nr:MAG: translation initiation factor IF-2 [Microgenomates group bacterium RIFCSPHIGHO2_01_FULL_45_11]